MVLGCIGFRGFRGFTGFIGCSVEGVGVAAFCLPGCETLVFATGHLGGKEGILEP